MSSSPMRDLLVCCHFSCCDFVVHVSHCPTRVSTDCASLGFNMHTTLRVSLFPSRDIDTCLLPLGCVRKLPCWFNVNVYPFVLNRVPLRRHRPASRATTAVNRTLICPMKTSDLYFTHGSKILSICSSQMLLLLFAVKVLPTVPTRALASHERQLLSINQMVSTFS